MRTSFRNRPRRDFTILRNAALRDERLSLKAKGMLALMMSFPDDWTYHLEHLEGISTDGRDATRGAVRELEAAGYVSRSQSRSPDGRLSVADFEVSDSLPTVDGFSGDGLSVAGKPAATKTERPTKTETHEEDQDLKPSSTSLTRAHPHTAFLDAWNEHRGNLPSVRALDAKRKRSIDALRKEHGNEALPLFADAVTCVAHDDFWVERQYTIDNLLRPGRVLEKAEKWRAGAVQLGTANLRMATQVERWARALDAAPERPVN